VGGSVWLLADLQHALDAIETRCQALEHLSKVVVRHSIVSILFI
jgi:hypothetical protein